MLGVGRDGRTLPLFPPHADAPGLDLGRVQLERLLHERRQVHGREDQTGGPGQAQEPVDDAR